MLHSLGGAPGAPLTWVANRRAATVAKRLKIDFMPYGSFERFD